MNAARDSELDTHVSTIAVVLANMVFPGAAHPVTHWCDTM